MFPYETAYGGNVNLETKIPCVFIGQSEASLWFEAPTKFVSLSK